MIHEFEIGDTVRLLSGGPLMTVNEYNADKDLVDCIWFNIDENFCSATFKGAVVMNDDDFDFDDLDFDDDGEDEDWEDELDEEEEK